MSILRTAFFAITLGAFALGATACGGSDGDTETAPADPAADEGMGDDEFEDDFGANPCGESDEFEDDFENPCGDTGDEAAAEGEEEDW